MTPKCPDCKRDQDDCCCKDEIESLRQQLAAALAACKVKDEALQSLHDEKCDYMRLNKLGNPYLETNTKLAVKALAVQPDDSALKAWIGEPVAWMITYDGKCMGFVPTEEANTVAVYSPKGLK